MVAVYRDKEADCAKLVKYESMRNKVSKEILTSAEDSLTETAEMLVGVNVKLKLMKEFLIERGELEYSYSTKLEELGTFFHLH
jgi:hypothetical protein